MRWRPCRGKQFSGSFALVAFLRLNMLLNFNRSFSRRVSNNRYMDTVVGGGMLYDIDFADLVLKVRRSLFAFCENCLFNV